MGEWISVKDRLPECPIDHRGYLCECYIGNNIEYPFYMVLNYYCYDKNPHFQHECAGGIHVSRWMKIPE